MKSKATVTMQDLKILKQAAFEDISGLDPSRYTKKVARAIERVDIAIAAMIRDKSEKTLKRMKQR